MYRQWQGQLPCPDPDPREYSLNICRGLRNFSFFSPVLKSPTHIGFIGVKKMGQKSHTWALLRKAILQQKQIFFFTQKSPLCFAVFFYPVF